ncbi:hypothetical protein ACHAW5_003340 [Stephanodiscus triporus]|uniref:Uncharacterized protein n=1 Tax=Stephanodiscus triporus TaxID=2934178 RepID=A0ABD3PD08_9STRA
MSATISFYPSFLLLLLSSLRMTIRLSSRPGSAAAAVRLSPRSGPGHVGVEDAPSSCGSPTSFAITDLLNDCSTTPLDDNAGISRRRCRRMGLIAAEFGWTSVGDGGRRRGTTTTRSLRRIISVTLIEINLSGVINVDDGFTNVNLVDGSRSSYDRSRRDWTRLSRIEEQLGECGRGGERRFTLVHSNSCDSGAFGVVEETCMRELTDGSVRSTLPCNANGGGDGVTSRPTQSCGRSTKPTSCSGLTRSSISILTHLLTTSSPMVGYQHDPYGICRRRYPMVAYLSMIPTESQTTPPELTRSGKWIVRPTATDSTPNQRRPRLANRAFLDG